MKEIEALAAVSKHQSQIDSTKGREGEGAGNRERGRDSRNRKQEREERLPTFSAKCVSDLTEGFLCEHHGKVR